MLSLLRKVRRTGAGKKLVTHAAVIAVLVNAVTPAIGGFPFCETTTIQRLAQQIDKLERHIDEYGTVTAKTPDVWGEARLTKYRREYEEQLAKKIGEFNVTINAAISRTDQAFLANSLALQAAISGPQAIQTLPSQTVSTTSGQTVKFDGTKPLPPVLDPEVTKVTEGEQTSAIGIPSKPTDPELTKITFDTITKTTPGFGTDAKVALEPVIGLDQLSRYLNHLQQLRRINDGDDQSDYPGYSLNLVRIPFSVLPGKKTREGYGAEVTVMAKPHLHEELLPKTFRHLVVNDVVDELAFPVTKIVDSPDAKGLIAALLSGNCRDLSAIERANNEAKKTDSERRLAEAERQLAQLICEKRGAESAADYFEKQVKLNALKSGAELNAGPGNSTRIESLPIEVRSWVLKRRPATEPFQPRFAPDGTIPGSATTLNEMATEAAAEAKSIQRRIECASGDAESKRKELQELIASLKTEVTGLNKLLRSTAANVSIAPSRRAELPFPPAQLKEIIGCTPLGLIADFVSGLKSEPTNAKQVLLLDVQKSLTAETEAAYEFLVRHPEFWHHCSNELLCAVRAENDCTIATLRENFLTCISTCKDLRNEVRGALAWAIIVESTLLNQRLIDDIKHLASAKNAPLMNAEGMMFYGVDPDPIARATFNQYVQCRWPIHVVALEPVTQDQNVADRFTMQREMQLAMSLAFATGNMSAQNFTRYARKISLDMETIDLNRTAVAFSHGDDTFGWRFMPRVQTPDIEGNCRVLLKDLIHGGRARDYDINQRRLEPGPRECTAIVIMPSFVPYVIFDIRTNWFKLTNPRHKEMTTESAVKLSAEVTCMRQLASECKRDAAKYRDDEAYRLCRAVESLERRLPLQSTYVPMPFDNSLGGFEFFNSGIPDLAPELHGYYGEPGIVFNNVAPAPPKPAIGAVQTFGTTIFLVGDKFSTNDYHVIAGNRDVTSFCEILSRQIMKVSIPPSVLRVQLDEKGQPTVDIHVATPYGISNHLSVVAIPQPDAVSQATIDDAISKHVAAKHVDKFVWNADDPRAVLTADGVGNIGTFQQSSNIVIKNQSASPFTAKDAELKCFILVKRKDQDATQLDLPTDAVKVDFSHSDEMKFAPGSDLEQAVRKALTDQLVGASNIEEIQLDGYLRFFDRNSGPLTPEGGDSPDHRDGQSILRIEGPLKLTMQDRTCPCPAGVYPTATTRVVVPSQRNRYPTDAPAAVSIPSQAVTAPGRAPTRMPARLESPPSLPPSRYAGLPAPPTPRPELPALR